MSVLCSDVEARTTPRTDLYSGSGTSNDPYIVQFLPGDPGNPFEWPTSRKWFTTAVVGLATFAVAGASSTYAGAAQQVKEEFHVGNEVSTLGVSLYVLGFAVGPCVWAPLSELFGRRMLYMTTLPAMTAFLGAAAGAKSLASLILFRFLAGTFGASPLTNSGGVVADMFNADQRGLGLIVFTAAPFLGPCVGPIVGGFGGMTVGWRWAEGVWAVFAGIMWIVGSIVVPETYAPILLQKRAARLTAKTGKAHVSIFEAGQGKVTARAAFQKTLARPWVLLFTEPIVFLLAAYQAILYGTLYMLFSAFPIVFRAGRGWNEGVSTLSYLGVICGEIFGVVYCIWDNKRYKRLGKNATPESRLPSGIVGGIAIPIGIFLFAWTNYMDIHWSVSIILVSPFGFGMVLVVLMCFNYLIDAYTIWAASVLAAAAVLRAIFGCVFPLFTTQMYDALGIHWASTIPGFIALACVPFPIVIARYGKEIRKRCKYSGEAYRLAQQSAS